jgi:uncharacterized membrane protein YkoI
MKQQHVGIIAAICACTLALGTAAMAFPGEKQYGKMAKVSLAQAQAIALKAYPGKIVSSELEKEKGGSGLRYSFDIKSGTTSHELGVDAITGKLLEDSPETKDSD